MIKLLALISTLIIAISCGLNSRINDINSRGTHQVMPGIDIKVIDSYDYIRRYCESNTDLQSYIKVITSAINKGNYTISGEIFTEFSCDEYIHHYMYITRLLFKRLGYIVDIRYIERYVSKSGEILDGWNSGYGDPNTLNKIKSCACTIRVSE
jgi:hypothetical protein